MVIYKKHVDMYKLDNDGRNHTLSCFDNLNQKKNSLFTMKNGFYTQYQLLDMTQYLYNFVDK
jgi:hypothetical protein